MNKQKPTKAMVAARKEITQKQLEHNQKLNDYNQKANIERMAYRRRIEKLSKDRDLAAEAAIGYGLAIKSIEENIRKAETELDEINLEIEKERPPYRYFTDDFKVKFGVAEHEVDWQGSDLVATDKEARNG